MTDDWKLALDELPLQQRLKAIVVYDLARDRAAGQPPDVAHATLRAAAQAEGLDTSHPWLAVAAARISASNPDT
ncbi:hypothetical protein JOD57_000872 [Geodermatophilus bullaregiensis]|uniref:hypothetical protein n=1 Tax=Geodermatophilus bullaregiensis TaxID=1564160 RepID=UPI00195E55EB|nr:hypothetical protein [Geodermatophilus bullaregiensis]MBM7805035.1 hypothetical protein [Geodermatophilus bullaregiensis]